MLLPYLAIVLLIVATAYSAVVSFRQKPEEENSASSWIFPHGVKPSARIFAGVATLLLVIGMGAWFKISMSRTNTSSSSPRSWRFLVPEGYNGWVRVEFEIPGAPPLPAEDGQALLKIPPSGLLRTSSPEQYGLARDHYRFYSSGNERSIPDSGTEKLIWGKVSGEEAGSFGTRKYEKFFVGTQQQFRDQIDRAKSKN